MTNCPECNSKLTGYYEGKYRVHVCWKCGHYQSNSLVYLENPESFKNMVRDNLEILRNFTQQPKSNSSKETADETEPKLDMPRLS